MRQSPRIPLTREKRQQLSAFIQRTRHGRARQGTSLTVGAPDPQRRFTPERHGLSPEQCRVANRLLCRADALRPLRGSSRQVQFRRACRIGGILSAIKRQVIASYAFGRKLQGYRGGRVMRDHALHHLREWAPIARLAAMAAKERREALQHYEATGEVLAPGERPAHGPEERRIRDMITEWEAAQWQQTDRYSW